MNQQSIAPVAKRSPMVPFAVALLAAVAYSAGIITTALVAPNLSAPSSIGHAAPITYTIQTHRVVAGPNQF